MYATVEFTWFVGWQVSFSRDFFLDVLLGLKSSNYCIYI